jgi:hypothetical protein
MLSCQAENQTHTTYIPYIPSNMPICQTLFNAYGHTGITKDFGKWWVVGGGGEGG